jgi:dipeptidyl aminopeptidase/acylaminoacyl peptidase
LPSIQVLAQPEEKLGGIRLNPHLWTPSRLEWGLGLKAQHLETGQQIDIPLPRNSEGIQYILFNPNPQYGLQEFVFTSKQKMEKEQGDDDDSTDNTETTQYTLKPYWSILTKAAETGEFQWKVHPLPTLETKLNFCQGTAYQFTRNGKFLLCQVVPPRHHNRGPPHYRPLGGAGPTIQFVSPHARKAPSRTYQDLLKNEHDKEKFLYYLTSQVVQVPLKNPEGDDQKDVRCVQTLPHCGGEGHIFQSLKSSPCGRFLLVEVVTELSYSVPWRKFGKEVQLWDLRYLDGGNTSAGTNSNNIIVATIPVDDEVPLSYDACSRHPREFTFHPCHPHTLLYVQALDGGDPQNEPSIDGERDVLYTRTIILDRKDDAAKQDSMTTTPRSCLGEPTKLVGLEWRYSDMYMNEDGSLILISEYRWKDRMERMWKVQREDEEVISKTKVWERQWQDRYSSPGTPLTRRGKNGQVFLRQTAHGEIFFKGAGASRLGDRPFLDTRNLESGETKRLWRCKAPKPLPDEEPLDPTKEVGGAVPSDAERDDVFESIVLLLDDCDTMLVSRESKITPRNYYLAKLSDPSYQVTVTSFPHPQPDFLGVTKELVHYMRKDGVDLTAKLYLPADYDSTPRPTLFWAYPQEFKDAKAAGQVQGSQHRFVSASWASPIHWAAKGWVVMDDFSLPVIGEGEAPPNDTFVEQIVDGASAAVEYAVARGVTDRNRCAVGGHSYGSFMTAHLLSHTSLFAAGIGRSGAFNRTLTPMSFQSEDRSLWEALDTYIEMSPLIHVKKYSEQEKVGKMLLIHGEVDENSGTHTMQSERYFAALKAFGIESRLCILPYERHAYRAKESILHMAWEQEEWLKSLEEITTDTF